MSTDWKALCAELLGDLENEGHAHWPGGPDGDPLIEQARAALAQPEPEAVGPTDEEIMGLMPQQMHDDLAAAVRAMAEQEGIDSTPAKGVMRIMLNRHVVDLARAAYAAGADAELEACVEWLEQNQGRWEIPASLRAARRPKPLSIAAKLDPTTEANDD